MLSIVVRPAQRAHSIKNIANGFAVYFTGEGFDLIFEILENDEEEMAKEMSQAMDIVVREVRFSWGKNYFHEIAGLEL